MKQIAYVRAIRLSLAAVLVFWVAAAVADDVDCGATITTATVVTGGTVTSTICANGLTVDGVELDLNGWTLQGDGSTLDTGVTLIGSGARLKNGAIGGFDDGVDVGGDGGHRLQDLHVADNRGEGVIVTSDGNRVENVVSENNVDRGFLVTGSKNSLKSCHALSNGGDGFAAQGSSDRLAIVDSTSAGNAESGIHLAGVTSGLVDRVRVYANAELGIGGNGLSKVRFTDNLVMENGNEGMFVQGLDVTLKDNLVLENGSSGLVVAETPKAQLQNNVAVGNGGPGFHVGLAEDVKLKRNYAIGQQGVGFLVEAAEGPDLQQNVVVGGTGAAFVVGEDVAGGAKLDNNTAIAAGGSGFVLSAPTDAALSGNRSIAAGDDGITVASGSTAEISRSVVFASDQNDDGAVDLADGDSCASAAWSENYLGDDEIAASGVTTNDSCIE